MKQYLKDKKVLVTGAGGFIGSYICQGLIEKGASVTAVVRDKSRVSSKAPLLKDTIIKEADLMNQDLDSLIKNHNLIIHAAAVDGGIEFKKKYANRIFQENVGITMNILKSLKKSPVEKFVFISSAEVYSNIKSPNPIKETEFSLFLPTLPGQWYAFSKIIGEQAASLMEHTLGIKTIIVRPANIYGQGDSFDKNRLVPTLLQGIKEKKKEVTLNGTGEDIRSFLYVEDYAQNLLQLLEYSDGGIYNFAGAEPISIANFTYLFEAISGTKITFTDKANTKIKNNRFILDISKAKRIIPKWYDSPYQQRIKQLLQSL